MRQIHGRNDAAKVINGGWTFSPTLATSGHENDA
jgi:hypothetical protein